MKTESINCDGCTKAIDPKSTYLEFQPLRGGLTLIVKKTLGEGDAAKQESGGLVLNKPMHFCGAACFGLLTAKIEKEIKTEKAPPTTATAAPIAAPKA